MLRSIQEFLRKINTFLHEKLILPDFIAFIGVLLILSCGMLLYVTLKKENREVLYLESSRTVAKGNLEVIGSVDGDVYFFPWCSGVERIKNKVTFKSEEEAMAAGRRLSLTCTK